MKHIKEWCDLIAVRSWTLRAWVVGGLVEKTTILSRSFVLGKPITEDLINSLCVLGTPSICKLQFICINPTRNCTRLIRSKDIRFILLTKWLSVTPISKDSKQLYCLRYRSILSTQLYSSYAKTS